MSYDQIKRTAFKLFALKGYDGTTIKDIANEVGLKPASIYSHFESKEEIYLEIWKECQSGVREYLDDVKKVINESINNEEEALFYVFKRTIEYYKKNYYELLFIRRITLFPYEGVDREKHGIQDFIDFNKELDCLGIVVKRYIEKNKIKSSSVEDIVCAFNAIVVGYIHNYVFYNIDLSDEKVKKIWTIFLNGINK